jgi:NADP-dependent 3-hydroxy acid dehydrogenase YdfG
MLSNRKQFKSPIMNIKEAKVLITGGSSGLGYETARQLIAKGAKVIISGRNTRQIWKLRRKRSAHYPLLVM